MILSCYFGLVVTELHTVHRGDMEIVMMEGDSLLMTGGPWAL